MASTLNSLGVPLDDITASISSIKRSRKVAVESKSAEVQSKFQALAMDKFKVVHWDGKLIEFLARDGGGVYEDANAVVLSSPLGFKPTFIAAPSVRRGTGQQLCDATITTLEQRNLLEKENTIGMVWDTTASNTGIHAGAAVYFERYIGHAILYVACRRHMLELHIKHAYDEVLGHSKAADNLFFKRFRDWWQVKRQEAVDNQTSFPNPAVFIKWPWLDPTQLMGGN